MNSSALVPIGHPLAKKVHTTLGECAQYPLALPIEGDNLRGILNQIQTASRIRPRVVLSANSFVMIGNIVAADIATSIQTCLRGAFANNDPRMVYVPLKGSIAGYGNLSCCVPAGRQLSPEASLFLAQLLEELSIANSDSGLMSLPILRERACDKFLGDIVSLRILQDSHSRRIGCAESEATICVLAESNTDIPPTL